MLNNIWNNIKKDKNAICGIVLALLLYIAFCMFVLKSFCPLVALTGIPCPGCGGIRTVKLLLGGHFKEAWNLNPVVLLWAGFAVYAFICRYVRGAKVKGAMTITIVICLLMLALYTVRMSLYFPDRLPYVFQDDNALNRIAPGYSDWVRQALGLRE